MYSRIDLPDHIREGLIALEQELDVPIRVASGSGYGSRPRPWSSMAAGDYSVEVAEEHGLTWVAGPFSSADVLQVRGRDMYAGLPENSEGCGWMRYGEVYVPRDGTDRASFTTDLYTVAGFDDQPIAEIRPREVYDWVNLTAQAPTGDFDTYVGDLLRLAHDPVWAEQLNTRQAERRAAAFQGLVQHMEDNQLTNARQTITALEQDITSYAAAIGRWTRDLNIQRAEIEARQQAIATNRGPEQMWAELENHARVTSVELNSTDSRVLIATDDIILRREDGEERWLGPFLITFNLVDCEVKMANKGNTRRGNRDHPHVNAGTPCLGDLQSTLTRAIGELQLLYALELCIQYLETLNLRDDWGQYGAWWFDVPDAREADTANLVEATT